PGALPSSWTGGLLRLQTLAGPALWRLFLDYGHAHDLGTNDPRIDGLAPPYRRGTRERCARENAAQRLDTLIRAQREA
ncbi:hypothetical protein ACFTUH_13190, partial [Streptomyces coelicoflavus]